MIISFHGTDHKTGVSQTAQGFAEHLAAKHPDKRVLLMHTDCGESDYFPGVRESIKDIRPYLKDRVADVAELAEKARCRDNLYIISGDTDFTSRESYMPDMAEYIIRAFNAQFDFVVCDSGCEADHGLSLGSLFCSDRVYMVIRQSEVCLARTEWIMPLYRQLRLKLGPYIICSYDKASPYTRSYVKERLAFCGSIKGELLRDEDVLTLRKSRYSELSEGDHRSLYSYGESAYLKDMAVIELDAAEALGFKAGVLETGRRTLWKNSVSERL